MTKRQVIQPLMSYRDPQGKVRHALAGETVDVADEHLVEFDKLNQGDDYKPPKPKGPAAQEPSPDSRRTVKKQAAKAAGRQPTPKGRK